MSRFDCDYDDGGAYPTALRDSWLWRAMWSKRAESVFADLEAALLALPEQRLIDGALVRQDGSVCAVGAYCLFKRQQRGEQREAIIEELARDSEEFGDIWQTIDAGEKVGLCRTLAWKLASLNDEMWWQASPEERYQRVLDFIRAHRQRLSERVGQEATS
jgi:hypothetical protein